MPSVGPSELILLIIIGLLILGPERLPRVASQVGRWVGKARRTANQLRYQMEREIALAEIDRTQSKKRDQDRGESDAKDAPTADEGADSGGAGDTDSAAGTGGGNDSAGTTPAGHTARTAAADQADPSGPAERVGEADAGSKAAAGAETSDNDKT